MPRHSASTHATAPTTAIAATLCGLRSHKLNLACQPLPHVHLYISRSALDMGPVAVAATRHDDDSIKTTVWVLTWAFMTLIWSLFTPPHRTFAARILIFQPLWGVRMYLQDATWVQDLALFLCVHAVYGYSALAWRFPRRADFWWLDFNNSTFLIYVEVFSLLSICGALAGGIVHRGQQLKSKSGPQHLIAQSIDERLLPPLLIPSRTSHSRLFPQKHAFSYSYLFVGIPIGIRGRVGQALSIDCQQRNWFHVRADDYLIRGNGHLGLAEKLKRYLHTQGVTDRDYSFAYLVTAPRFLGYCFNPVSFWYLYDSDIALKYMILEVNNTFDERRMYLLKEGDAEQDAEFRSANGHDTNSREQRKATYFTNTWDKDFHVSPFNSRKGSYSLRAVDPLAAYQETGQLHIDNTIVLRSSKDNAKLVARVWSQGASYEADTISSLDLSRFIISWWWVGLITFPRIAWEAQRLFFRRKLHVWYRPEVADTSIGRSYTEDEVKLEGLFHSFLEDAVQHVDTPFRLVYRPAHAEGEDVTLYSPGFTYEEDHGRTLTLQVISPSFYSRFVHYSHAKEAFDREYLATDENNQTLLIKNPSLLPVLLDAMQKYGPSTERRNQTFLSRLRWSLLRRLRCPPANTSYGSSGSLDHEITDIRSFCDSELDLYVEKRLNAPAVYCRVVTKLFLAQRFALNIPAAISAIDWACRISMLWATMYTCNRTNVGDVLRPSKFGLDEVFTFAGLLLSANSIHMWSFLKG